MSQITTCPSCGTRFRVVADQLRISDGWVRCGQCQEVFDARNYLDAAIAPAAAPAPEVASPPAVSAQSVEVPTPKADVSPAMAAPKSAVLAPAQPVGLLHRTAELPAAPETLVAVPAPAVQSAPGYELPSPEWSDDLDAARSSSVRLATAPAPASSDQLPKVAAEQDITRVDTIAHAALPTTVGARAEPQWNTPSAAPAAAKSTFPALDSAWLPATPSEGPELDRIAVQTPSASAQRPDTERENGLPSTSDAQEQLSEAEHLASLKVKAETLSPPAEVFSTPEVEDPVPATVPVDAIESAAQKLAQAEPKPTGAAASAAAPAFPFAAPEEDDPLVLDSSLEPGFVRDARRKAWWQKPVVRVAMGAGVVVLPVALAVQIALHERNALVAWQPSLRPALEFMCTALQCKLGPRQHIASMVVSGSAFAKSHDRSYQLSLSIQNKANTPVGMPAVELTLTDAQDQAIARKVIAAKELGAPQELKAGAEWSGAVPVTTNGLNLQVSGYRVLLFYP